MTEEKPKKKSTDSKRRKKASGATSASSAKAAKAKKASQQIPPSTRFEDAMEELEHIVETLESGDQPLEDSLARFERGIGLARFCQKSLADAEQKVMILTGATNDIDEDGEPGSSDENNGLEPFELNGDEQ